MFHEFDTKIYPYKFWILISKDIKIIDTNFEHYYGGVTTSYLTNISRFLAFTIPVINKTTEEYGTLLVFPSKKEMTASLMAHECSHAIKYMFTHINADVREHEPFEYALGALVEFCDNLKKNKIQ